MNESEYKLLLAVMRGEFHLGDLNALPPARMTVWMAGEDPATSAPRPSVYLSPVIIARRWRTGVVNAVSLEVDGLVPRNRCVFNCSDGSVQESGCDNDPQDIQNCMDAVKGCCRSSGVVTTIPVRPGMFPTKDPR